MKDQFQLQRLELTLKLSESEVASKIELTPFVSYLNMFCKDAYSEFTLLCLKFIGDLISSDIFIQDYC